MVNRCFIYVIAYVSFACGELCYGQSSADRLLLGLEGGVTYSQLYGDQNFGFRYEYPFGEYKDAMLRFSAPGNGWSTLGGLRLQIPLSPRFGLITTLEDVELITGNAETIARDAAPDITGPGQAIIAESYQARWSYTTIQFLLRYLLVPSWLYAFAGGSAGVLTGDGFNATQRILAGGTFEYLPSGSPTGSNYVQLTNYSSIHYYSLMRGGISVGVGSMLPFFGSLVLTPEIAINIPFLHLFTSEVDQIYASQGIKGPSLLYGSFVIALSIPISDENESGPPTLAAENIRPVTSHSDTNTPPVTVHEAMVSGTVRDQDAGSPIASHLTAIDLEHGARVAVVSSDSLGHFALHLAIPGRYSITAESPNHLFHTIPLTLEPDASTVSLPPFELPNLQGQTQLLIFFGYDNASLSPESYPELLRVVELLTSDPQMKIEIDGHTDSDGSKEYNQALSEERSGAVRNFLILHGIAAHRIVAKGFGKSRPVASNETEEGRAKNRRVEMKVISGS